MIEMSAKRRKYKFNVLDYLWYMGKDCLRRQQFTPFDTIAYCLTILPIGFCGYRLAANFPNYADIIFYTFLIGAGVLGYSVIVLLMKYRYTPEREREYFRRYPERTHYSRWIIFIVPIIVIVLSFLLFDIAIKSFINK